MCATWEPEAEEQDEADRADAAELDRQERAAARLEAAQREALLRGTAARTAGRAPAPKAKAAGAAEGGPAPKAKAAAKRAPPRVVAGPLPYLLNGQGRAYYALRPSHPEGPAVSVGHNHTLAILGGGWFNHGAALEGFGDLASAINAVLLALPAEALPEVRVISAPKRGDERA